MTSQIETLYSVTIQQDGDWWVGWVNEVSGVNCQAPSKEELMRDLRDCLAVRTTIEGLTC